MGLGDLLQLLGNNAGTGILTLKNKYVPDAGLVYLSNGNPIHAQAGGKNGLEGLMALFGWLDGEFSFTSGPVTVGQTIKKSRNAIILDALQLLDDGQIEKLGPVSFKEQGPGAQTKDPALPVVRGPLVDYMYVVSEEEFADGTEIIAEGSHGSWVWIILDGVVEIVKKSPGGKIPLLRLTNGSYVGSLASFRPGDYMRSASVVAVGNVQLGVMDSQRLSVEFSQMSPQLKALAMSLDRRLKQVTTRTAEMKMGQALQAPGIEGLEPIVGADRSEEGLFVIDQGEAHVVAIDQKRRVPLAVLTQGDLFGCLPFLDLGHEPYGAEVVGSSDLTRSAIDVKALETDFQGLSLAFRNFYENVATCVAATTKLCCQLHKKATAAQTVAGGKVKPS